MCENITGAIQLNILILIPIKLCNPTLVYLPQYPSAWPLLIIELVAHVVPARLIIRLMEGQMREKWNFLRHPRLTSGGEGLNLL